jgi:hypothetical protein
MTMERRNGTPRRTDLRRLGRSTAWLAVVLLAGCRITDHSERGDEEVTPDLIRFEASGYEKVEAGQKAAISFKEPHLDMGRIVQGSQVDHRFEFRNTGGSALVITDVRGSCGCTVSKEWPRFPIKPGEKGSISVTFDSEGRTGRQDKTVTVVANTNPPSTVLTLTGEVVGPAAQEPIK